MSPTLVFLGAVVLSGCAPDNGPGLATVVPTERQPVSSAEAEPSPSEDPLLVEARELYRRYLDTSAEILKSGEIPADAYEDTSTPDQAKLAVADAELGLAQGLSADGVPEVVSFEIVERTEEALNAAACIDNSAVTLRRDGVEQARQDPGPRLVTFQIADGLLISAVGRPPDEMGLEC